jgi:hypothetical protein
LDVLALADQRTQLALRGGSAFFDWGPSLTSCKEVATPSGAVDFNEPGLYQIGMEDGNVIVSVLSGLAQVIGEEGSQEINAGEVITLLGANAAQAISSKLAPTLGGEIVDDYYRTRYPLRMTVVTGTIVPTYQTLSTTIHIAVRRAAATCRRTFPASMTLTITETGPTSAGMATAGLPVLEQVGRRFVRGRGILTVRGVRHGCRVSRGDGRLITMAGGHSPSRGGSGFRAMW